MNDFLKVGLILILVGCGDDEIPGQVEIKKEKPQVKIECPSFTCVNYCEGNEQVEFESCGKFDCEDVFPGFGNCCKCVE